MKKTEKLQQVLSLKALQKRRAEIAYRDAAQRSTQLKERADALRQRHREKQAAADVYAAHRFMKLQAEDQTETFFTTLSLGLFRVRKDAASLGLRLQRLDKEYASAQDALRIASANFQRTATAEKLIGDAYSAADCAAQFDAEQQSEDETLEILQAERPFND